MAERTNGVPGYGTPNYEYFAQMAGTKPEDDGPIYMVNLMRYRAVATYPDGNPAGISGREADNLYTPTHVLSDIGAEIVFAGDVERQILGEPKWDRIGVVRYPTRAAFLQMQQRTDFREKHVHKNAGMEQTIVMGCVPSFTPTLPAPDAKELAAGDRPFVMLHVMRYADGGQTAMQQYASTSGAAGLAIGVRPAANMRVEGTIVGDGRKWDEVRFNRFPSHAAFEELVSNPVHQAGQAGRAGALADTFAMMVLPFIDRLSESIQGNTE